jgi:hypothetical protein
VCTASGSWGQPGRERGGRLQRRVAEDDGGSLDQHLGCTCVEIEWGRGACVRERVGRGTGKEREWGGAQALKHFKHFWQQVIFDG